MKVASVTQPDVLPARPVRAPVGWAARHNIYYGWLILAASGAALFNSAVMAASTFTVFVIPMSAELGWTRTHISTAIGIASFFAVAAPPIAGRWVDRRGGRLLLGGGSLAIGLSLIGLGFVNGFLAFYVLFGIGRMLMLGVLELVGPTVVSNWFIRKRGLAIATAGIVNRIGLGFWPAFASLIIVGIGWRATWWTLGIIVCILSIFPIWLIVGRRPEEFGLLPDGATPRPVAGERANTTVVAEPAWTLRQASRLPVFWLLLVAVVAIGASGAGLGVHRWLYFQGNGMATSMAGVLLGSLAVGMVAGGIVAAWMLSRVSSRATTALVVLASGAMTAGLPFVPPTFIAFVYVFFEGVALGAMYTAYPVLYADYFGRGSLGSIRGVTEPLGLAFNAFGVAIAGALYDLNGGSYLLAFVSFGVSLMFGALLVFLSRRPVPRAA